MTYELGKYASSLAEKLQTVLQIKLPRNFNYLFIQNALRVGVDNYQDFGSLIILECLEEKERGKEVHEKELSHIIDRVRHRITRQVHREVPVNTIESVEREAVRGLEKMALLRKDFSTFLKHLSSLHLIIFHHFFLEENSDREKMLKALKISQATFYRELRELKKLLRNFVDDNA